MELNLGPCRSSLQVPRLISFIKQFDLNNALDGTELWHLQVLSTVAETDFL